MTYVVSIRLSNCKGSTGWISCLAKAPFQTSGNRTELRCIYPCQGRKASRSKEGQDSPGNGSISSTKTARVTASSASPARSSKIPCICSPRRHSRMVKRLLIGMRRIAGRSWIVQQGMGGPVLCLRRLQSHSLTQGQISPGPRRSVLQQRWRQ